jgi:hypothetical protein
MALATASGVRPGIDLVFRALGFLGRDWALDGTASCWGSSRSASVPTFSPGQMGRWSAGWLRPSRRVSAAMQRSGPPQHSSSRRQWQLGQFSHTAGGSGARLDTVFRVVPFLPVRCADFGFTCRWFLLRRRNEGQTLASHSQRFAGPAHAVIPAYVGFLLSANFQP